MMGSLTQHMRNPRDAAKLSGQARGRGRQQMMLKQERENQRQALAGGVDPAVIRRIQEENRQVRTENARAAQARARAAQARRQSLIAARQQPVRATQARQMPQFANEQNRQLIDQAMRSRAANRSVGTNPAAAAPGGAPNARTNVRAPGVPDSRQINKGGYMKKTTKMNMGGYANCGASVKASGGKKA